jgi:hypothetical protein
MLVFFSNTCIGFGSKLNSSYNGFINEQCTYLAYVLLEAPREYVLHGPLLSINWLWLCPHLGGPRPKPRCLEGMFIVLMTAAHISPNISSLRNFLSNIHKLFLTVQATSFNTYYTSHLYSHLHLLFYMSCSHIHPFGSSWQAGCPRFLVSDTLINTKISVIHPWLVINCPTKIGYLT